MRWFGLIVFLYAFLSGHAMADNDKEIYGYIEKITLLDNDLTLSAKLDTGAKSSSLNASKISEVTIDNKPYLRFTVPSKEGDIVFQCEYIGEVNIKIRAGESHVSRLLKKWIRRPVVLMRIKLGSKEKTIRVNLTNRKRFIYPFLMGREALVEFNGLVDPSLKYTHPINASS